MKQKKQLAVLSVLLLIAGLIWFLYLDHDKPIVTVAAGTTAPQLLSVENPQLHTDRLKRARETEYKSTGRNIFSATPPPPPPPPPTLPLKFFGYGTVPFGSARRAFFTDGEEVYVVAEGELLLNRFRILKVGNANLEEQGAPPSS